MSDSDNLTLCEIADAIARGEITALAATQRSLARMETLGQQLNCIVELDHTQALEAAEAADKHRASGSPFGPLHGVPLAHKDLFYRKGRPCAGGTKILRGFIPEMTATVLTRLENAGALHLGTLHMAEFALSPTGYNEHYGHCRNPWNPDHVPGGSSSGSGAAVAARLVSGALGSDTGGSIRHPAAMCGVTGLKPTWSRVSRAGCMPLSWSLDCIGPLAQSARDCARLLAVIAGEDPADPTASTRPVADYEAALNGDIRGVRIAVPADYYYEHVTPDIRKTLEQSLAVLRDLGASIVRAELPDMALINALGQLVMTVEAATVHRKWLQTRPQDYADQVRSRIEPGLLFSGVRYAEALTLRAKITREFLARALGNADVLHLPALSIPVPTIAETTSGSAAEINAKIGIVTHCTRALNYLGLPALAVPCGFLDSLPMAFQLVGYPFDEGRLLAVADAYQRVTDFHLQTPPFAHRTACTADAP